MGAMSPSSVVPTCSISFKSVPKILMPMGVRMPVVSISTRVLIGMIQAFVHPGKAILRFISAVRSSQDIGPSSGHTGCRSFFIHSGDQDEYQRLLGILRH